MRVLLRYFGGPDGTRIWSIGNKSQNIDLEVPFPARSPDLAVMDFAAFPYIERRFFLNWSKLILRYKFLLYYRKSFCWITKLSYHLPRELVWIETKAYGCLSLHRRKWKTFHYQSSFEFRCKFYLHLISNIQGGPSKLSPLGPVISPV